MSKNIQVFSRLAGNPTADTIEELDNLLGKFKQHRTYFEGCCGTGSAFFNISDHGFERWVLCDWDPNITNMLRSLKISPWEAYDRELDKISEKYGDLRKEKEAYDGAISEWTDAKETKDKVREGLLFHIILNSCLNAKPEYNDEGEFTASWGKTTLDITKSAWEDMRKIMLERNPTIITADWHSSIKQYNDSDTVFFLDQPWPVGRTNSSYVDPRHTDLAILDKMLCPVI